MVAFLIVFGLVQGALLWLFLWRPASEITVRASYLPDGWRYTSLMVGVLLLATFINVYGQVLCRPVAWTYGLLTPAGLWLLFHPYLPDTIKANWLNGIGLGATSFVNLYLILFLGNIYWLFAAVVLLVLGLGFALLTATGAFFSALGRLLQRRAITDALLLLPLLILGPFALLLICGHRFVRSTLMLRWVAVATFCCLCLVGIYTTHRMARSLNHLNTSLYASTTAVLSDDHFTELVLGTHWKYHTRFSELDGARPPFHDPIIPIAYWLLRPAERYPEVEQISYKIRRQLYRKVFPEKPVSFNYTCGCYDTNGTPVADFTW